MRNVACAFRLNIRAYYATLQRLYHTVLRLGHHEQWDPSTSLPHPHGHFYPPSGRPESLPRLLSSWQAAKPLAHRNNGAALGAFPSAAPL